MFTIGRFLEMGNLAVSKDRDICNPHSISHEERQKQLDDDAQREKDNRDRERRSPYKNFLQVNKDAYKLEDKLMAESPIAYRIFRFLTNHMDGYNAVVCSQAVLQESFQVGRTTIYKAVKLLKDKQFLTVYKSGSTNIYTLNKNIVWNSWGTNFKYAKFEANIVLSESEQEKKVQAKIKSIKHKEVVMEKEKEKEKEDPEQVELGEFL